MIKNIKNFNTHHIIIFTALTEFQNYNNFDFLVDDLMLLV